MKSILRLSRFYSLVIFFLTGFSIFSNKANAQVVSITGAGSNTSCTGWGVITNAVLSPCAAIMPSNFYNLAIGQDASSSINFNMNTSMGSGYILLDFDLWMGKLSNNAGSAGDYVSIFFNGNAATNEYFRISQISNGNYTIVAYNGGSIVSAPIPTGTAAMAKAGRVVLKIPFSGRPTTAGSTTALTFFHSAGSNDYGLSFYKLGTNDDYLGIGTQPTNQSTCLGNNASFIVTPTGSVNNATPTYTYQWYKNGVLISNGGIFSGVTTSTLNLTGVTSSEATSYTCVVSSLTNSGTISITSNTATLTVNALPTITGTLITCAIGTSQLTGSSTANATTPWLSSNTAIAIVSPTGLVTGVSIGTATITYTNSNGCQVKSSFNVTQGNTAGMLTGTSVICKTNTATLTNTNSFLTSGATLAWTSSNNAIATVNSSGVVTGVAAGTATITCTISGGCGGTVIATKQITVVEIPAITIQPSLLNQGYCLNARTGTLSSSATNATNYQWYFTTSNVSNTGGNAVSPNGTSTTVSPLTNSAGDFYYYMSAINAGCSVNSNLSGRVKVLANCTNLDADGDGVPDEYDIDDDNDGIIDAAEESCNTVASNVYLFGSSYWQSISWTGGEIKNQKGNLIPNGLIDGDLTAGETSFAPIGITNDVFTNNPITFTLISKTPLNASGFGIVNDYGVLGDGIKVADIILYNGNSIIATERFNNLASNATSTFYAFSKKYSQITKMDVKIYEGTPGGGTPDNQMQVSEIGLYTEAGSYCIDLDTDGDGIPNILDLDSDGDGCPDAKETNVSLALNAGTIVNGTPGNLNSTSNVANSVAPGPYGSNGLANSLETAIDNGIINYTSFYTNYALNNSINACTDSDGMAFRMYLI